MSSHDEQDGAKRQRLTREARHAQLVAVAWRVVGAEGTEALTLGHLAEEAGVTKPVVYSHFPTRPALLAALYRDFDATQTAMMDEALAAAPTTLVARSAVIAASYVDCVLQQGRQIPGIVAALAGSPELAALKGTYQKAFIEKCRRLLAEVSPGVGTAALWAILGAAEVLSRAASEGEISPESATRELTAIIVGRVGTPKEEGRRGKPAASEEPETIGGQDQAESKSSF